MLKEEIEFKKYEERGAYHWDQISKNPFKSNAFVKGRYLKCIELLENVCRLKNKKILDYGCGDGALAYLLWKRGAKVYGIDNSEIAIKYAIEKHKQYNTDCHFELANYETTFENNYFDFVICADVIEHVLEPLRLIKEIKRVLKIGGYTVVSTPIRLTYEPLDGMHVTEWFPQEFMNMISLEFQDFKLYESHPLFWTEMFNRSFILKLLVNVCSFFDNPFINTSRKWRYYVLQYAVAKK
ncbi:MAG: class I SAM-dependent methyltransferase [Candidatus Pacearchaeota archaeon]